MMYIFSSADDRADSYDGELRVTQDGSTVGCHCSIPALSLNRQCKCSDSFPKIISVVAKRVRPNNSPVAELSIWSIS